MPARCQAQQNISTQLSPALSQARHGAFPFASSTQHGAPTPSSPHPVCRRQASCGWQQLVAACRTLRCWRACPTFRQVGGWLQCRAAMSGRGCGNAGSSSHLAQRTPLRAGTPKRAPPPQVCLGYPRSRCMKLMSSLQCPPLPAPRPQVDADLLGFTPLHAACVQGQAGEPTPAACHPGSAPCCRNSERGVCGAHMAVPPATTRQRDVAAGAASGQGTLGALLLFHLLPSPRLRSCLDPVPLVAHQARRCGSCSAVRI